MVKYCTECGTQLDDSARFCTNCGTKIDFQPDNPINEYQKNLEKTGRKRAKIPHLGGINEFRQDSIVIKKTEEVIPIKDIENFSLHQSTRNLWSDVKVDFDYNGLHYRTQQAGSDKGKLQTLENKIKARDMQKFANVGNNAAANRTIASQRNKEEGTRGYFDLGADFKPVDFANAGIGILGSVLSHAITRSSLKGLEKYAPTRPALYRAGKLVTNYNINPQLTNLERARQQGYRNVDSNTSSSVTALDRKNTIGLNTALAANELYGTKYNKEAELLNKDTLNQQEIANKNVEAYNQYMTDRRNYLAGLATRRSLSNVGLIQGIGSSLSNMIQSGMDRYDNNNEIGVILNTAYPGSQNYMIKVNPRLAKRLGLIG